MTDLLETNNENNENTDALKQKDEYIQTLEQKLKDAETRLAGTKNMEELADDLMKNFEDNLQRHHNPGEKSTTNRQEPEPDGRQATTADLAEQVRKILNEENDKAKRQSNVQEARNLLKQEFGEKYTDSLEAVANVLGVSTSFLGEMAARSPKGLVDLVKMNTPATEKKDVNVAPPASNVDPARSPSNSVRKNAAYYRELRKTDLQTYLSRRVQSEMHKEAMEQGPAFYQ